MERTSEAVLLLLAKKVTGEALWGGELTLLTSINDFSFPSHLGANRSCMENLGFYTHLAVMRWHLFLPLSGRGN
jgi:hypothetical protein